MINLIILSGLPASGKSTYAMRLVQQGYKRINDQDLGLSLDNGLYSSSNKQFINLITNHIINECINNHYNVVIDNYNLNPATIEYYQKHYKHKAKIEVVEFDVPVDICIQRDLQRTQGRVGRDAILRMYEKWIK